MPKIKIPPGRFKAGTVISNLHILEYLGTRERPSSVRSHNKYVHVYSIRCKCCKRVSEYLEETMRKRIAMNAQRCKHCSSGRGQTRNKDTYYATPEERDMRLAIKHATANPWGIQHRREDKNL